MTQQHPITPPPELVRQWLLEYYGGDLGPLDLEHDEWYLLRCAAEWGYQQHEKELLDAMHAVVPQPYEPEAE
jgi:hypothetical protein